MSAKLPTHLLTTTPSAALASFKPTFLSLRVLQSQCPPQNPSRPPLHFLTPALYTIVPRSPLRSQQPQQQRTNFSTTPYREKKGGRRDASHERDLPSSSSSAGDDSADLMSTTGFEEAIEKSLERLRGELAKVSPGGAGRDVEALEGVRVQGGLRLGDVAQVVPRGKNVNLLVGEKEDIKAIISSLRLPPLNLNAQTSPTEPLTLTIALPPITQESRQEAAKAAGAKGDAALSALREARGAQRKKLQGVTQKKGKPGGAGTITSDEFLRAEKEMEKIHDGAVAKVKKMVEEGKKRVMG